MTAVLLDTHTWAWSLYGDRRLSSPSRALMAQSETVSVSVISVYEISQKVRLGKWPEMEPFVVDLEGRLGDQGGRFAPVSPAIANLAGQLDWPHRDPFDRIIAATAIAFDLPLVSADPVFDGLPLRRIW